MSHSVLRYFLDGLLLGWGASVPLGPMNVEVIRRHLTLGLRFGLVFGFGACIADLTYFVGVYFGMASILTDHAIFYWIGWLSVAVLLCFAFIALRAKVPDTAGAGVQALGESGVKSHSVIAHTLSGYAYTLINPYTIIFWVAVAAQITTLRDHGSSMLVPLGVGIMLAVISWIVILNALLHRVKKRLKPQWMRRINYIGAGCLFLFVIFIVVGLLMKKF